MDNKAKLFFVGPRPYRISDENGNFVPGVEDVSVDSALAFTVDLTWFSCIQYQCSFRNGEYSCDCLDKPEFAPQDPIPGSADLSGNTIAGQSGAMPLVLMLLFPLLLCCCYGAHRSCLLLRYMKRRQKILDKLDKLNGLGDVVRSAVCFASAPAPSLLPMSGLDFCVRLT
jgi:hypothetical protein